MLKNFVVPDLYPAMPEVFLVLMACVILLVDAFLGRAQRWITASLTMIALVGCALITYQTMDGQVVLTFSNMFVDRKSVV